MRQTTESEFYIIGGGPSVNEVGTERLRKFLEGRQTIGCNKSAFLLGTRYLCSIDQYWMRREYDAVSEYGERAHLGGTGPQIPLQAHQYYREKKSILCRGKKWLAGLNSGHAALNLAYHMGAQTVYLLGIDFNMGYWHGGYAWGGQRRSHMDLWVGKYDQIIDEVQSEGVQVFDCSVNGALQAAPKISLCEMVC